MDEERAGVYQAELSVWKGTEANSTVGRPGDGSGLKIIQLQGQRGQITRVLHFKLRISNVNLKAMRGHQRIGLSLRLWE